ncbi:hypothetical protein GCM10010521_61300 [Streptomyces rameus]|uniref:Tn3 transposase DDE domain-containing protein n=1 Tax=Streptomyces rameus TaxID=68261 RepID=A0ABN3V1D4_9ACTN
MLPASQRKGPAGRVSVLTKPLTETSPATGKGGAAANLPTGSACSPVLNAIVVWTARYIDAAVAQLRAEGHETRDEDIARLSPLKHKNLNLLGRYSFTASTPTAGALHPLRDPDVPELDEDEDGEN